MGRLQVTAMNLRQRQALRLIADNRAGITAPVLAARGCDRDTLSILIRAGFVTEVMERVLAGDRAIEIFRFKATEAGIQALKG
jgi:hypothetical protein